MSAHWLLSKIRDVPDFPKPGILFKDITPIFRDPPSFRAVIEEFRRHWETRAIDVIAGIESRGFLIGTVLAYAMGKPFHLVRKKGKLPPRTVAQEYALEYGTDAVEMHEGVIDPGTRVLLVDDLLATGGTMRAACELVARLGGEVAGCAFLIELAFLPGRERLGGVEIQTLVTIDGQ